MSKVCVLLANGFEEIEAVSIIDVLRRADIKVTTLGVEGTSVKGAHGISLQADALLSDGAALEWDMVILPGGMPGAKTLKDSKGVQALIKAQHAAGRLLGAICAAPMALGAAGVLAGKKATSYPGYEDQLVGALVTNARVVKDGNVITSQGPGTAVEFALAIVEELTSAAKAEQLRGALIV